VVIGYRQVYGAGHTASLNVCGNLLRVFVRVVPVNHAVI
jgi:hypothetical protein